MTQQYISSTGPVRAEVKSNDRPLTEIVGELWENTEKLVRQELELAMAELDRKVDRLKVDVSMAVVGGAVIYAGLLAIVAGVILLLSKAIDPWLAALIVGVVISGAGFMLLQRGKKDLTSENIVPEKTAQSVQRSAQTFKEAVK
jgi:hypothetical protein